MFICMQKFNLIPLLLFEIYFGKIWCMKSNLFARYRVCNEISTTIWFLLFRGKSNDKFFKKRRNAIFGRFCLFLGKTEFSSKLFSYQLVLILTNYRWIKFQKWENSEQHWLNMEVWAKARGSRNISCFATF